DPQTYGAMLSFTLPWLSGTRKAAARAAAADEIAERRAAVATTAQVKWQGSQAYAGYLSAAERFEIVDHDPVPQARRAYEAAHATYAAGGGDAFRLVDALRSFLEVRLDRERALVELEGAIADLERAAGGPVARRPRQEVRP